LVGKRQSNRAISVYRRHHATSIAFYRATLRASAVFAVVRCLPVRPSVTLVHCIYTAERIVELLSRPGSPIILVFSTSGTDTQFQGEPLQRGCKIQGDQNCLQFSTEITVCLSPKRHQI